MIAFHLLNFYLQLAFNVTLFWKNEYKDACFFPSLDSAGDSLFLLPFWENQNFDTSVKCLSSPENDGKAKGKLFNSNYSSYSKKE